MIAFVGADVLRRPDSLCTLQRLGGANVTHQTVRLRTPSLANGRISLLLQILTGPKSHKMNAGDALHWNRYCSYAVGIGEGNP